jgi:hypothetical protein
VEVFTKFFFTTPYLVLSMCLSLVYIHFYEEEIERAAGILPPIHKLHRADPGQTL